MIEKNEKGQKANEGERPMDSTPDYPLIKDDNQSEIALPTSGVKETGNEKAPETQETLGIP